MKTVCSKHEYAYEVALGCPWCEPPTPAQASRLKLYTRDAITDVLMTLDMGRFTARFCLGPDYTPVMTCSTDRYEIVGEPGENPIEVFVQAVKQYREKLWDDHEEVSLIQTKASPMLDDEIILRSFTTQESVQVGLTVLAASDVYRFFIQDYPHYHCTQLNVSYINTTYINSYMQDFYLGLVKASINALDLNLTVKT